MAQKMCCEIIPVNLGMVNAFLLKGVDGKSILIDCGVPGSERSILKKMTEAGIQKNDLQLMIITHGHSDHMGASSALREITGAKTVIHTLDAETIRNGKNPKVHATSLKGKILGCFIGEMIKDFVPYEPEIVIDREMSLNEFGIDGRIIETPGHTKGSVSVVLDDGNVFVGDLIMGAMLGMGKPQFPMYADSIEETKSSIRKIVSLSPKTIYVGHGGAFSIDEVNANMRALRL